ncbi:MAG TPA: glycosyltransferase family 2 protein [Anaerolineae bacterium]|nr:glycosyltransferase family 2 protein [Anaerolineae bacterium]
MDLTIIIPCCNEEDSVPQLAAKFFPVVEQLRRAGPVEVVFVDDGSTDGTYARLQDLIRDQTDMQIARHPVNRGLGAALRTGFAHARGDIVVTADSDGTYRFEEMPALLARLRPDVDIVTASPYHKHGKVENVSGYRIFLSRGSSFIYQLLLDRRIATYTALFRAYRREVVQRVPFYSDGFLAGTELMVNAMCLGYRVAEHPSTLHARQAGASKAKTLRIIRAHLRFQGSVLLRRLRLAPMPKPLPDGGTL